VEILTVPRRVALPCLAIAAAALLGAGKPSEYELKAALLLKFAGGIEWPAESFEGPTDPVVIAVLGDDPFGGDLDRTFAAKTVVGRPVVIERVATIPDSRRLHVLFLGERSESGLDEVLRSVEGRAVLTVGEVEGWAARGVVLNFRTANRQVRYEINADAARRAGLRMSPQLLRLGTVVGDGTKTR
jgi:hypothetical protein